VITVAVDGGGSTVKFYDGQRLVRFPSAISYDWRKRNLEPTNRKPYDFDWEYRGEKGFAGELAQRESTMSETRKGNTKAHPEARLRILIALHQYGATAVNLIVGQPIKTHTAEQKQAIKQMLIGRHEMKINDETKTIIINRCEVAPEGASAGLLIPHNGTIRTIDIGSGTINCGTLMDRAFVDRQSFTIEDGMETVMSDDPTANAKTIFRACENRKWGRNDEVYALGGGSTDLYAALQNEFPRIQLIDDPVTANVRAFHLIGRRLYDKA
jgi:plasmid segregation protein ParM